jgi:large subunit ribosomal protein L13
MNTTYSAKPGEVARSWYVVDATGQTVGRLATRIANVLRGVHKPQFTPHVDTGDFVVVVNADKIELTGRKLDQKFYFHYTGYPGGLKGISARALRATDPERMLRQAVEGMLPKNRLSRQLITKLKVYAGAEHPHRAQTPQNLPDTV